jgi:hypothetical protein
MPACARATIAIHTGRHRSNDRQSRARVPQRHPKKPIVGPSAVRWKNLLVVRAGVGIVPAAHCVRGYSHQGGGPNLDDGTNGTLLKQTLIGDAKEGKGGAEARNPRNRIPEEHHTRLSRRVRPGNDALHWRTGSVDPYASRGTCTTKGRCACTTNPSALRASERCVRWGTATERCPLAQCESRGCTTWYHRKAFQRAARVRRIGGTHICQ